MTTDAKTNNQESEQWKRMVEREYAYWTSTGAKSLESRQSYYEGFANEPDHRES